MSEGPQGELLVYVGLGQSLLASTPYLRPLSGRPGLLDKDRAFVFGQTGEPATGGNPLLDLPDEVFATLYPHARAGRSGPLTAAATEILSALAPHDQLLTVNLARKGAKIGDFGAASPSASFRNLRRCLERAAAHAAERGLRLERLVLSWVQGQGDRRAPRTGYLLELQRIVADVDALFAEVTAGRGRVLICLSQLTATEPQGRRSVPLAQSDLVTADPDRCILAGPEYMLERSDGVHLKPRSAVYLGALHGRAIVCRLQGNDWQPLHMVRAEAMGAAVKITFAGGVGPLDPDYQPAFHEAEGIGVRTLPHLGFGLQAAGQPGVALLGASILGPRDVRLDLSAPLVAGRALVSLGYPDGIGHPEGFVLGDPASAKGGATTVRTTGSAAPGSGLHLHDWALQQLIAVTGLKPI